MFGKNDVWFWIIFSAIHILSSLALSTQIYYMGRFKIGESTHTLTSLGKRSQGCLPSSMNVELVIMVSELPAIIACL